MTVEIDGVGPVRLERSPRARRLRVSIRPFGGARVAVPERVSFELAERFARSTRSWLQKHLARVRQAEQAFERVRATMPAVDVATATTHLTARLETLAAAHGFTYRHVRIRRQRTLWGSCSAHNDISLNAKLMRLAPALIDYVILHELVHTRFKHHRASFWDALGRLVEQPRAIDARLKQYPLHVL